MNHLRKVLNIRNNAGLQGATSADCEAQAMMYCAVEPIAKFLDAYDAWFESRGTGAEDGFGEAMHNARNALERHLINGEEDDD